MWFISLTFLAVVEPSYPRNHFLETRLAINTLIPTAYERIPCFCILIHPVFLHFSRSLSNLSKLLTFLNSESARSQILSKNLAKSELPKLPVFKSQFSNFTHMQISGIAIYTKRLLIRQSHVPKNHNGRPFLFLTISLTNSHQ